MKIKITLMCLTICAFSNAQDMSFSNIENAPLYYNPALTGVSPSAHRLSIAYRNQWMSISGDAAYQTGLVSYDAQLNPKCAENYWSVGGTLLYNRAGDLRWTTYNVTPSVSYRFQMSGRNKYTQVSYLSAGFAFNIIQHRFNTQSARWGEQLQNGVFNPTIDPNEPLYFPQTEPQKTNFDASAGLFYYLQFSKNHFNSLSAGLSIQHLARPDFAFTDSKQRVPYRLIGLLSFEKELNNRLTLNPEILASWQQGLWSVNYGADFILRMGGTKNDLNSLRLGLKSRLTNDFPGDALIVLLGINQNTWALMASFEANTSKLNVASKSLGSFEIAGKYRFGSANAACSSKGRVDCPKKF
jgi:type IX secretion system PorP/SprF family membrane protein